MLLPHAPWKNYNQVKAEEKQHLPILKKSQKKKRGKINHL
jgi:hypothetical protein